MKTITEKPLRTCVECGDNTTCGQPCKCVSAQSLRVQSIMSAPARETRFIMGIGEVRVDPYRSNDEQGLPDSDTQDAPVLLPSLQLTRTGVAILLILLFVAAFAWHCGDGLHKARQDRAAGEANWRSVVERGGRR